jgi:hypothetical protein
VQIALRKRDLDAVLMELVPGQQQHHDLDRDQGHETEGQRAVHARHAADVYFQEAGQKTKREKDRSNHRQHAHGLIHLVRDSVVQLVLNDRRAFAHGVEILDVAQGAVRDFRGRRRLESRVRFLSPSVPNPCAPSTVLPVPGRISRV